MATHRKASRKTRSRPEGRRHLRLTVRELDVLGLMAKGLKNKEIGAHLSITYGTVKIHVHNILFKLGVNSRTGAIAKALSDHVLANTLDKLCHL